MILSRLKSYTLLIVVGVCAILWLYPSDAFYFMDDVQYVALGKALARGDGFTNSYTPAASPALHYPPGYPLILAALSLLSASPAFAQFINALLLLAILVLTYELGIRLKLSQSTALTASLLLCINPALLKVSLHPMSEPAYVLVSILAVLLLLKLEKEQYRNAKSLLLLIVLLSVSFYLRYAGLILIAAFIGGFVLLGRWKPAIAIILGCGVLCGVWIFYEQLAGNLTYVDYFVADFDEPSVEPAVGESMFERVILNSQELLSISFMGSIVNSYILMVHTLLGRAVISTIFITVIYVGLLRRSVSHMAILVYVLLTIMALLGWPTRFVKGFFGTRFFIPLLPFLMLGLLSGTAMLVRRLESLFGNKLRIPSGFAYLLLLPMLTPFVLAGFESDPMMQDELNNYKTLARWSSDRLPEGSVVSCAMPALFNVLSDSKAIPLPWTEDFYDPGTYPKISFQDPEHVMLWLDRYGATHIATDELTPPDFIGAGPISAHTPNTAAFFRSLYSYPDCFTELYSTGPSHAALYSVNNPIAICMQNEGPILDVLKMQREERVAE